MSAVNDPSSPKKSRNTGDKRPSPLESLPLELLQEIFLYSLNPNLLCALPSLANEDTYRWLISLAFSDNDYENDESRRASKRRNLLEGDPSSYAFGRHPSKVNSLLHIPSITRPLGYYNVALTSRERGELQSNVLQCDWCTNERIRGLLPDLARLIFTRWCVNAGYTYITGTEEDIIKLKRLLRFEEDIELYTFRVIKRKEIPPEQDRNEDEEEYEQQRCQISYKAGEFLELRSIRTATSPNTYDFFPLLSLREIPSSLISADIESKNRGLVRGSFTDAHLSLLDTLRLSGRLAFQSEREFCSLSQFYSKEVAISQEALKRGINIAFTTANPRALDIFLSIDDFLNRDPCDYYYGFPIEYFRIAAQVYVNRVGSNREKNESLNNAEHDKFLNDALLSFCILLANCSDPIPADDDLVMDLAELVGGSLGTGCSIMSLTLRAMLITPSSIADRINTLP